MLGIGLGSIAKKAAAAGGSVVLESYANSHDEHTTIDTTEAFTLPAGYVNGDILVALFFTLNTNAITGLTGWTKQAERNIGSNQLSIFTLPYVSGTPDRAFSYSGLGYSCTCVRLSGGTLTGVQTSTTATTTPTALSGLAAGGYIFDVMGSNASTAGSGGPSGTILQANDLDNLGYGKTGGYIVKDLGENNGTTAYNIGGGCRIGIEAA